MSQENRQKERYLPEKTPVHEEPSRIANLPPPIGRKPPPTPYKGIEKREKKRFGRHVLLVIITASITALVSCLICKK